MRLSHIEIENFKGIGTKQSIDLAPITLLFGPNSAGKSTILQALHYLREILERNNPDPDQTIAGGLTDLGGFATFIHNHDLNRAIRIKVRIDMTNDQGSERLPLNSGSSLGDPDLHNLGIRYIVGENTELEDYAVVQEIGLSLEVRWSDQISAPYVSEMIVEMDGQPIAAIHSPAQEGRAQLRSFNFAHPCLQEIVDPKDYLDLEEAELFQSAEEVDVEDGDPFSSPLGQEIWELSRELSADSSSDYDGEFRVAVGTKLGALPDLDKPLVLDLVEIDKNLIRQRYAAGSNTLRLSAKSESAASSEYEAERQRRAGLSALLDELMLGPVRIVRDNLTSMTYCSSSRFLEPLAI